MANCTSTALAPKTAAIGNASSTLELLNELVKQGAIVIQNATILQDVTVNHSNISVASKDCHQTITTHCMGEKQMEVEQTICPAGHEVTTSNEARRDVPSTAWNYEVPTPTTDATIQIIPNIDSVPTESELWGGFSYGVCGYEADKHKSRTNRREKDHIVTRTGSP